LYASAPAETQSLPDAPRARVCDNAQKFLAAFVTLGSATSSNQQEAEMLKKIIQGRLDAWAKDMNYDTGYIAAVLDADLGAFMRFVKVERISNYRKDVPVDVAYAVKLTGTLHEDCGPCAQLMVTMGERAGVPSETLRAVAARDDAALSPDLRLGVQFARAVLARDPVADQLRDQVLARWGKRGLVTLGFGLVSARIYPTLKYAMGYGRTCSRLVVGGKPVAIQAIADPTALVA
jgi:hypothetical protein